MDYRARARDAQPTLYMTLGGIVQSLVLTFLVSLTHLDSTPNLAAFSTSLDAQIFWLRFGTAFLVIILVWHEYTVGLLYFWWVWGIGDSVLPFLMGIVEYHLVTLVASPLLFPWLYAMMWVSFVGLLSYLNQYFRSQNEPENEPAMNYLGGLRLSSIYALASLCVGFWYSARWAEHTYFGKEIQRLGVAVVFSVTGAMLLSSIYSLRLLRKRLT